MTPNNKKYLMIGGIAAAVLVLAIIIGSIVKSNNDMQKANELLQLENQQLQLAGEYENLNDEYQRLESQTQFINNDSLLNKYTEAKSKVEKLLAE